MAFRNRVRGGRHKYGSTGIRIAELTDRASELTLQKILDRLEQEKESDSPDPDVIRQCLDEVEEIQEKDGEHMNADMLKKIVHMAQAMLDAMDDEEESEEARKKKKTTYASATAESKLLRLDDLVSIPNLTEAVVTQSGQNVEVVLLEEGWSLNSRYYSAPIVESLPAHVGNARKIFVDHLMSKQQLEEGRHMRSWAAQVEEAWAGPSKRNTGRKALFAKIHVFDRPDGWLKERIEKFPEEVGLSISAWAKQKEGEAEGRKGMIIEEIKQVESFDFVDRAAAGGRVTRIAAGMSLAELEEEIRKEETPKISILKRHVENLKNIIQKDESRDKIWRFHSALIQSFREIANADKSYAKEDDKQKAYSGLLDEFKEEMLKLPLTTVFKNTVYEVVMKTEKEEQDVEWKDLTLTELCAQRPDLIKSLREGFKTEMDESEQAKAKEAELKAMKERADKAEKDLSDERSKAQARERVALVDAKLAEAKLPAFMADEALRNDLIAAKDVAEIDNRIARQKTILENAKDPEKVKGNGPQDHNQPLNVEPKPADDSTKKVGESADADAKVFEKAASVSKIY